MLLVSDVGNTNLTFGVFDGDRIVSTFRMTTKQPRTSDEYGIHLRSMLLHNHVQPEEIEDVIIASVVPNVMHSLLSATIKYLDKQAIVVEPGIKTGIRILAENPKQVGADKIVDAAAAFELYGGPVFVIDFGTATTYDFVDESGALVSSVIAPGIRTSAQALWQAAAKLPEIEIRKPDSILAKETIACMQAGIVFGQIGQTEYIVNRTKEETGLKDLKVVATGGLGKIIANETESIDIYDPNLTLQGLRIIYHKQKRGKV
ncbi:MAG: type III pantothenate kinase [Lachnospiraceae bacterium]|jgi:type III pantothenate kinase|nr:type III pantothenate kinase [Lachnospiraceae bacterium]